MGAKAKPGIQQATSTTTDQKPSGNNADQKQFFLERSIKFAAILRMPQSAEKQAKLDQFQAELLEVKPQFQQFLTLK